jgi:hypothetical protein
MGVMGVIGVTVVDPLPEDACDGIPKPTPPSQFLRKTELKEGRWALIPLMRCRVSLCVGGFKSILHDGVRHRRTE